MTFQCRVIVFLIFVGKYKKLIILKNRAEEETQRCSKTTKVFFLKYAAMHEGMLFQQSLRSSSFFCILWIILQESLHL